MKIAARFLIAINVIAISIPTITFAHPGHETSAASNLLHHILHSASSSYIFLLLVIVFAGLSVRALINK